MFENIGAGEFMFCAIPGSSFHVWNCDDCKKWHSELIMPVREDGEVVGIDQRGLDDAETLAECMANLYKVTMKALSDNVSTEVAEIVREMYDEDFNRLLHLYDAFSVWAARSAIDD